MKGRQAIDPIRLTVIFTASRLSSNHADIPAESRAQSYLPAKCGMLQEA